VVCAFTGDEKMETAASMVKHKPAGKSMRFIQPPQEFSKIFFPRKRDSLSSTDGIFLDMSS
jgi:preprotein translocase subunit SecE